MNPWKAVLLVACGVLAVFGGAYVSGMFETGAPGEQVANLASSGPDAPASRSTPSAPADAPVATTPAEPTTAGGKAGRPHGQPAAGEPAKGAENSNAKGVVPPSFDIVRVEPDGSIVIAGKAAPNAAVEIVEGATVIGTAKAGAEGDFATVLAEPLKPGNYEIVLRATAPGNVVATSPETAVVAIPETPQGQVLALVERPGEPSRLITVPVPEPKASPAAPEAPAPGAEAEPSASETPAAPQPPRTSGPAPAPAQAPAQPQTAMAAPEPPAAEKKAAAPVIAVEAVEIEGRRIFIAGRAEPGRTVRVYANDILLGETRASPAGRFLIETERDLAVGDYIVRADMLGPDGADVLARAAVPFTREAGEFLAAVAPQPAPEPQGGAKAATPAAPDASAPTPSGQAQIPARGEAAAPAPEPTAPAAVNPPASDGGVAATGQSALEPVPLAPAPQTSEPLAPAPEPSQGAVATAPAPQLPVAPPADLAPKLESVKSAVIIRRGDSLWRISRRVYGRGVRYSTIYLANQDQIEDPDRIWPGQVFKVPDKTGEGEEADMSTVGDQATTFN